MIPTGNDTSKEERGTKSYLSTPENIDNQGKDDHFFSFFKAPITNKFPSKKIEIQELHELIKSDSFSSQTMWLRSSSTKEDAKHRKSSKFDYVTFSGIFSERNSSCLVTRSIYLCVDIDHIGDKNTVLELQILILNKLRPVLMFISPSGDGLKVVYRINPETGTHIQFFRALQAYFKEVIGYEIDVSGSDISRACFLPHDPEVYYNEHCDILEGSFLDTFAYPVEPAKIKDTKIKENSHSLTSEDIYDRLVSWLETSVAFKPGSRNQYVSRLAYACNRFGIVEGEALNKLLSYSEHDFDEDEIKAIVKSVYKHTEWFNISNFTYDSTENYPEERSRGHSLTISDQKTPLFPISGFPDHIQNLINECVTVYSTHRDFWAISFLQATAIAMGSSYEIKDKYTNGALLWAAIVAPTGMGKTEPMDLALRPIIEADSVALEAHNNEKAKYLEIMELSPKERKEQGVQRMSAPVLKQYIAVDITPEALTEAHANNRRGIAICRDELTGWIADFGRYSRSGEVQNMLSSWSEKHFKINRKNSVSAAITKPFIPVFGGIQPGKLYQMAKDDRALDGFMQRFVFAYPDEFIKAEYSDTFIKEPFTAYYKDYIKSLLSINYERKPIMLSPGAKQRYKEFFNHNTALFNRETDEYMKAVYQKLEIIVLRLALILHVSNHVLSGQIEQPIQPDVMSSAIEMVEYFRITAHKVNVQIGQAVSSSGKLDNRSVARYLMQLNKSTKTTIAKVLGTSRSHLDRLLE